MFEKFLKGSIVCVLVVLLLVMVVKIRILESDNEILRKKVSEISDTVEKSESQQHTEEKLVLLCSSKPMVFDAVNGIRMLDTQSIMVETPYKITLYQVKNLKGEVIENNYFEATSSQKKFSIKPTEDISQIMIAGFSEDGTQCTSKVFYFEYLDKPVEETEEE